MNTPENSCSSMVSVYYCSGEQCLQTTEYHCHSCKKDLCRQCQQDHATNLNTKQHRITLYKDKVEHISNENERCSNHQEWVYKKFCDSCQIPICLKCRTHKNHIKLNLSKACVNKQKQFNKTITKIRSDFIYKSQVMLSLVKPDMINCREMLRHLESAMETKAKKIKDTIDRVLTDDSYYENLRIYTSHMMKIKRYISKLQICEKVYEQLDTSAIKFIHLVKNLHFPRVQESPVFTLHRLCPMTNDINSQELITLLADINVTEKRKRHADNKTLLKLMDIPDVINACTVAGVDNCHHISCAGHDQVWVSDVKNLILSDIEENTTPVCFAKNQSRESFLGFHSVNSAYELIYIDTIGSNLFAIKKRLSDKRTEIILKFNNRHNSTWFPICVFCSPSTGDILVGMRSKTNASKVARYTKAGKLVQSIQHNDTGNALYGYPTYITENKNGDILVSDKELGALIVADSGGIHRFSYTGRSTKSKFSPCGICTDAYSQILVCDSHSQSVHLLDEDGKFISQWNCLTLEKSERILTITPVSLSYDSNSHLLWAGSQSENTVSVIRYISRHHHLTGKSDSLRSIF